MKNELAVLKKCKLMETDIQVLGGCDEVWITREQIGRALGYSDPKKAIEKIHMKHRERLDRYSMLIRVVSPNLGGTQETMCYSAKGVYEICRWSRQPKADEFYDKVYDLLEQVRKDGFCGSIDKETFFKIGRKLHIGMNEYAERMTGQTVTARLAEAKREAEAVEDWSIYRFSVPEVQIDTGYSHGEILNMARKKKIDKRKDLAAYVQGELRFTYQGRMVIEAALGRKPEPVKAAGEPIKWTFG